MMFFSKEKWVVRSAVYGTVTTKKGSYDFSGFVTNASGIKLGNAVSNLTDAAIMSKRKAFKIANGNPYYQPMPLEDAKKLVAYENKLFQDREQ